MSLSGKFVVITAFLAALAGFIFIKPASGQRANLSTACHVLGVGLPTVAASPSCDEKSTLASRNVTVTTLTLSNTAGTAATVTVEDCQGTPYLFLDGTSSLAAHSTTVYTLNGIRFSGCFEWAASATTVMGALVAQ